MGAPWVLVLPHRRAAPDRCASLLADAGGERADAPAAGVCRRGLGAALLPGAELLVDDVQGRDWSGSSSS